ncbi:hypothetical protein HanRHA438_Chr07g0298191 [Helianthus annuus]|nr:hypothetical protein HanRHA438_Chr07g0298191 [Helianthus annuus]
MSVQLDMFKQYLGKLKRNIEEEAADNIINNSVAVIVASNNDLLFTLLIRRLQYDAASYANMIVNMVLNLTQGIARMKMG